VYSPSEISGAGLRNDSGFFISGDGFGSLVFAGGQIGNTAALNGDFDFGFGGPHGARIDGTTYSPFLLGRLDLPRRHSCSRRLTRTDWDTSRPHLR